MKTYGFFSFLDDPEIRGVEELDQTVNTVPDMSLSVKQILERFRRGTLDVSSLYREDESESGFDDDFMDGIDDIAELHNLKLKHNDDLQRVLQRVRTVSENTDNSPSDS